MEYRTLNDLRAAIVRGSARLPRDLDLIVGIPRSGLLAANLLALHLNLPLTDIDGLLAGRLIAGGARDRGSGRPIGESRRILVVDDSVSTGAAMARARARLASSAFAGGLEYAAVFVSPRGVALVDYAFEVCRAPRFFEWNFMHHSVLARSCVDIDGVLCVDPTEQQNDDGPAYLEFLRSAAPLHVPTAPVAKLVTSRLERYRAPTEEWLARHGVNYGELIMLDLPSRAVRMTRPVRAEFKAEVYRRSDCRLFIESSQGQAARIANLALRPVFCVESGSTFFPSAGRLVHGAAKKAPQYAARRVRRLQTAMRDWLIDRLKY